MMFMMVTIIAFSRKERTHPSFVLALLQPKKSRDILATPPGYFRGFGPRFPVNLLRHSCAVSLNWIFTLIAFDIKGNAVLMQTGVRVFCRA